MQTDTFDVGVTERWKCNTHWQFVNQRSRWDGNWDGVGCNSWGRMRLRGGPGGRAPDKLTPLRHCHLLIEDTQCWPLSFSRPLRGTFFNFSFLAIVYVSRFSIRPYLRLDLNNKNSSSACPHPLFLSPSALTFFLCDIGNYLSSFFRWQWNVQGCLTAGATWWI